MAYGDITADVRADWITFALTPGVAFGSQVFGGRINPPSLPGISLTKGTVAGKFDLVGVASGTMTNVTPGTTDTVQIDLKALTDPLGAAVTTMVKCIGMFFFNFAQDDVSILTVEPAATNPFTSFFSGTGGINILPAHQDPSSLSWKYGFGSVGGMNTSGYAVGTTNKGIKLTSGASTSLPWRAIILGRSA